MAVKSVLDESRDIERAVSLSDEKYCSATAMVRKSAEITHEVVLVEI